MNSPLDIQNVRSIPVYFQTILESCANNTRAIQDIALPALKNIANQIQNSPSLPLSTVEVLSTEARRIKNVLKNEISNNQDPLSCQINNILSLLACRSPLYEFSSSTYLDRDSPLPSTYFDDRSMEVIIEVVILLKKAVETNDLGPCFYRLLEDLGKIRKDIAIKQESKNSHRFGEPRYNLEKQDFIGLDLYTPFRTDNSYKEYLIKFIHSLSTTYNLEKEEFREHSVNTLFGDSVQGYSSEFNIQFIDKDHLLSHYDKNDAPPYEQSILDHLDAIVDLSLTDAKNPSNPIEALQDPTKTLIYTNTVLTKAGSEHPLSSYFIIIDNEEIEKDFIDFNKKITMVVMHQEPHEIKHTLEETKNRFIECMHSKNENELKENLAIFRYLFAHMAPYQRGSAWTAEIFEKAICSALDYECSYGSNPSAIKRPLADLDALIAFSLSDFIKEFSSKIILRKIPEDHLKISSTP
ncbi:MAG: hypothetical protein V4489_06335 [Chlamydiota bacterium]